MKSSHDTKLRFCMLQFILSCHCHLLASCSIRKLHFTQNVSVRESSSAALKAKIQMMKLDCEWTIRVQNDYAMQCMPSELAIQKGEANERQQHAWLNVGMNIYHIIILSCHSGNVYGQSGFTFGVYTGAGNIVHWLHGGIQNWNKFVQGWGEKSNVWRRQAATNFSSICTKKTTADCQRSNRFEKDRIA